MKKKKNIMHEALKAYKKKCREEEIATYGHPLPLHKVVENRKKYKRCRDKFDFQALK